MRIVLADRYPEDPAEEDDVMSERGLEGHNSDDEEEELPFHLPRAGVRRAAFTSLDEVVLVEEFVERACVMKSVPRFLRGPYRITMRVALEEINTCFCHECCCTAPQEGELLRGASCSNDSTSSAEERGPVSWRQAGHVAVVRRRRSRRGENDLGRRVDRAEALVHMGELSSARQALEGASLAPGSEDTLQALRDPAKRPQEPRTSLPRHFGPSRTWDAVHHGQGPFCTKSRSARRGAAGGPSGMTVKHLQPLLDRPRDLQAFLNAAEKVSRAHIPPAVQEAIRLGRLTALQKANGGVRVFVAGDIVRRFVARTMSQQLMESVQAATAPFQYAMSTKSGCECIAHALQGLTELNPRATVMSIDGISAYDLVSRESMLQALADVEGGSQVLSFVSMFYGAPSQYLWEDSAGRVHTIKQGEGGEQGDAMMPLLFSQANTLLC